MDEKFTDRSEIQLPTLRSRAHEPKSASFNTFYSKTSVWTRNAKGSS